MIAMRFVASKPEPPLGLHASALVIGASAVPTDVFALLQHGNYNTSISLPGPILNVYDPIIAKMYACPSLTISTCTRHASVTKLLEEWFNQSHQWNPII